MAKVKDGVVAATPYARLLAKQRGVDLNALPGSGSYGEVRSADVLMAAPCKARITPLARRMAEANGIDTAMLAGSGYLGRIFSRDLENIANAPQDTGRERMEKVMLEIGDVLKKYNMSGMRRVIAKRMLASHLEIPSVTHNMEVDVTALMALRAKVNADRDKSQKVSVNDFILKAVAATIREQERYRMQIVDGEYILHSVCNVGMAVGLDDGLLVPVIRRADEKTLFELSAQAKELSNKARQNRLQPDEVGCGVITVSNLGMYGVHSFTPIINQPEAAILGVNAAIDRLMLVDGNIESHKIMMLSLTYDHRIINGTEAAAFVTRVKELIEHPDVLL